MPEMIERVGERLRKECLEVFGSTWSYDVAWRFSRAAIEEMRENTPAMSEAMRMANMNIVGGYGGPSGWEAAIDAALKEHEQ